MQENEFVLSNTLSAGQTMLIEIKVLRNQFKTELIGYRENEYLICRLPDVKKYGYLRDRIKPKSGMIVRTICENTTGEVAAFESKAIGKLSHPDQLLFLSYPRQVITHALRKEVRQQTVLDAVLYPIGENREEGSIHGQVINVSNHGCGFEFSADGLKKIDEKTVLVEVPTGKHPQFKVPRKVSIRSQRYRRKKMFVGLEFEDKASSGDTSEFDD